MAQLDSPDVGILVGQLGQAAEQPGLGVGHVIAVGIFVVIALYLLHITQCFETVTATEQGAGRGDGIAIGGIAAVQEATQVITRGEHIGHIHGFVFQCAAQCAGAVIGRGYACGGTGGLQKRRVDQVGGVVVEHLVVLPGAIHGDQHGGFFHAAHIDLFIDRYGAAHRNRGLVLEQVLGVLGLLS